MRGRILTLMIVVLAVFCGWMMIADGPSDRPEKTVKRTDVPVAAADQRHTAEPSSVSTATEPRVASLSSSAELPDDPVARPDVASITGVVYDISTPASMGAGPLARATVVLSIARPRAVAETIEGQTGSDGRFSLDVPVPASVTLTIKRKDFVPFELPGMILLAAETRDLGRINLPRGGRVLGRVIDEKGLVVGGARVLLGEEVVTSSNADGAFELSGLPWGLLSLRAEREGYSSVTGPEIEVVPRVNEEIRGVVLHLANFRRIAGVVRDQAGNPLAGAEVSARLKADSTREASAETGASALDRWKYEKFLSWALDQTTAWERLTPSYRFSRSEERDISSRWESLPPWIVEHFARKEGRRPELNPRRGLWAGSVETFHSPSERESFTATTDPDGRFEVMGEFIDRAYDVTVHHRGYDPVEYSIERPDSEPREIALTRQAWLTFTVSDPRGKPLVPMVVKVRSDLSARDWTLAEFWSEGDQWYASCPQNGDWAVRVWSPLHIAVDSGVARVLMGETRSVGALTLSSYDDECFYIVAEDDGAPIRGAEVTVRLDGQVVRRHSDELGSVCIPSSTKIHAALSAMLVNPSTREVAVTADGFVPMAWTDQRATGIRLSRAGWLEGTVYGFDKKPLAGVPVGFFSKAHSLPGRSPASDAPPSSVSGRWGKYRIDNLKAGPGIIVAGDAMPRAWLTLSVLSGTNHVPGENAAIVAGEGTRHDVELAELYGEVGGQVFIFGTPAAGLDVSAIPVSYAEAPTTGVTAMDGTFVFPPLIPGTYLINVSRNGRPIHKTAPFDLSAGDRPRFAIHVELGSIEGSLRVPPSFPIPGSVVLHEAARFESGTALTGEALRTLVRPGGSFAFPQVGPGDYVVTGLERDSGLVPARVTVAAGQTTAVVLEMGETRSVEIEFDWRSVSWVQRGLQGAMQFEIEDRDSRLRWTPSVEWSSGDRRKIRGLAICDRLHVTANGLDLVTVDDPFAERDGPLIVTMMSGTKGPEGQVEAAAGSGVATLDDQGQ